MAPRGAAYWNGAVRLDLDFSEIDALLKEFDTSEKMVTFATGRALRRTATTMRLRSSKAVIGALELRSVMKFRRRLREIRFRRHKTGGMIGVWIGLNDLAVSSMKGRIREYEGGASFRSIEYPGAFVAKVGRTRSIYKRRGKGRFPISEVTVPIKDQIDVILEDEVLPDVVDVFLKNLRAELRARTIFGVGQ